MVLTRASERKTSAPEESSLRRSQRLKRRASQSPPTGGTAIERTTTRAKPIKAGRISKEKFVKKTKRLGNVKSIKCDNAKVIKPMNYEVSLDSLPEELITEILNHVLSGDPRNKYGYPSVADRRRLLLRTCRSLALTSRRLNNTVTAYMYHTLYNDAGEHANAHLILRTLLTRPDLAALVGRVEWAFESSEMFPRKWSYARKSRETDQVRNMLNDFLSNLQFLDHEDYLQDYDNGCSHDLLGPILLRVSNVRYLRIGGRLPPDISKEGAYRFLEYLTNVTLGKPFGLAHKFESLREVHIFGGELKLEYIAPIFLLPSLRILTLEFFKEREGDASWPCTPGASFVEELCLKRCYVDTTVTARLIQSCRRLRRFQWAFDNLRISNPLSTGPLPQLRYPDLVAALRLHARSLRYLSLTEHSRFLRTSNRYFYATGVLGCIRDFLELTSIEVDFDCFFDEVTNTVLELSTNLPASIESLRLKADRNYATSVTHLAASFSDRVPRLRYVSIDFLSSTHYVQGDIDRDRGLFARGNVEFQPSLPYGHTDWTPVYTWPSFDPVFAHS